MRRSNDVLTLVALGVTLTAMTAAPAAQPTKLAPLQIQEQGSFLVGGKTITNPGKFDPYKPTPEGQTYSGDHAYVFYQVPVQPRKYPLIMWHGLGQFSKTWETTPDGREGYQNIFLRRRQCLCHRSAAARRCGCPAWLSHDQADSGRTELVRRVSGGIWPNYPGVQFSKDPQALDQYFRQMTRTSDRSIWTWCRRGANLLEKTGPASW
jgi:hypothetical protein